MRFLAIASCAVCLAGAAHAEPAFMLHSAPLLTQAQADAATVTTLSESTQVDVLRRRGAWSEIKTADGKTGWVRMLSLRFDSPNAASAQNSANPLGALTSLLSSGRTSNTATVTTGVRGLSAEELENAQANPGELQKMRKNAASREAALAFAKRSRLSAAKLDYLAEPAPVDTTATEED